MGQNINFKHKSKQIKLRKIWMINFIRIPVSYDVVDDRSCDRTLCVKT